MGGIAFLLGALVGGFLLTSVLSFVVEKFAFRDLPPDARAFWTTFVAWIAICGIAGFGYADGLGFAWTAGFWYVPGAVLAGLLYRRRLRAAWSEAENVDTFS